MTIGDEKVVSWLLDSGGNRTYWADEETARKEYGNLCVLGYRSDTTLTSLIPQSAYAELAAERDSFRDELSRWVHMLADKRAELQAAESQLAELREKVVGLAEHYDWLFQTEQDDEMSGRHIANELRTLAAADGATTGEMKCPTP